MARKKKSEEVSDNYVITYRIGADVYKGEGATILEALEKLPAPPKIFIKSFVTVSKGDKSFEQVLTVPRAKRLFMPIARVILSKHFQLLLK